MVSKTPGLKTVAMKLGEGAFPVFRALVISHVEWCGQFWTAHVKNHNGGSEQIVVEGHKVVQGLEKLC